MKKITAILLSLLIAFASVAQDEKNSKEPHLVFLLENNDFYFSSKGDSVKTKIEKMESFNLFKIITKELNKYKEDKKDFSVVITGDGVMSHPKFEMLLESLFDKKIYSVKISTSMYD